MPQVRSFWHIVLAMLCLQSIAVAQNGPDRRISQLQVLDQFAGTWTGTQPGTKRKVQAQSEWILGGRVLQTKLQLTDGREMLILRTYDPGLKKYVATIWDSQGMAMILSGDWNPQEKSLSVATEAGNLRIRADWKLEDENTEHWQVVFADANGKELRKTTGTNRREQQ
jgi:hypothetical protein